MADFTDGVYSYIRATAYVTNYFPMDSKGNADISCYQCKFFSRNNGVCQLTKDVTAYPQRHVGRACPLNYIENIKEENNEGEQT